jgi:hypothetical protein
MKHLLTGVAIAAALAIAAPAFAQAPPTTSPDMGGKKASGGAGRSTGRVAPAAAPAEPAAAAAPAAPAQMHHHRPMRHMVHHHGHMGRMTGGDAMTDQLNREELARIQGAAPMAPPPGPPPMQGGPRPSGH